MLSVERTHDTLGNDTADGLIFSAGYIGNSYSTFVQYLDFKNNSVGRQTGSLVIPYPFGAGATLMENYTNKVGLVPAIPLTKTGITNPGDNLLFSASGDLVLWNPIPVSVYSGSSPITYLPVAYSYAMGMAYSLNLVMLIRIS
jgi:hypothetical protein